MIIFSKNPNLNFFSLGLGGGEVWGLQLVIFFFKESKSKTSCFLGVGRGGGG